MNTKTAFRAAPVAALLATLAWAAVPETVRFPSADGRTELTGYVFKPSGAGPHPGVVMLHGRGGPYSSLKRGTYNAETLTQRHRMWGEYWGAQGYVAMLVDSFGPRGYPEGFPKHSYGERPAAVSERAIRPLDAYGALAYLRTRADVSHDRIGLHGWSNGGMTLLSAMGADALTPEAVKSPGGFRAAVAQYPSCRTQLREPGYKPYAPLLILAASEDDEVSPEVCREFAVAQRERGAAVEFVVYAGAQHGYDDPGKTKQSQEPNRAALQDSLRRAGVFFARHLKPEAK